MDKKTYKKAPEGIEPSTSCLLDRRSNHWAMEPNTANTIVINLVIGQRTSILIGIDVTLMKWEFSLLNW